MIILHPLPIRYHMCLLCLLCRAKHNGTGSLAVLLRMVNSAAPTTAVATTVHVVTPGWSQQCQEVTGLGDVLS